MNYNQTTKISNIEVSEQDCILAIKSWVDKNSIDIIGNMRDHIPNVDKLLKTFESKQYLGRLIFHGGCLNCNTPLIASVGICTNCKYYEAQWDKEDLSFISSHS